MRKYLHTKNHNNMHCTINRKYLRYFERNPRNSVNICANIYGISNGFERGLLPSHQQAGSTIPQSSLINDIKSIAHGHTYCLSAWLESNAKKISMSVENCDLESKISWRHQGLKYTFFLESWSVKLWNCPMYVICVQWWKLWWSWEHWLEH